VILCIQLITAKFSPIFNKTSIAEIPKSLGMGGVPKILDKKTGCGYGRSLIYIKHR
jgi:hypothetical protein